MKLKRASPPIFALQYGSLGTPESKTDWMVIVIVGLLLSFGTLTQTIALAYVAATILVAIRLRSRLL